MDEKRKSPIRVRLGDSFHKIRKKLVGLFERNSASGFLFPRSPAGGDESVLKCHLSFRYFVDEVAQVREENQKLKTLVADLSLDKHILQDVLSKKV